MSSEAELLGERIAEMAAHLDAATHQLLTALREFDRSGNWFQQGARTCAEWLSWRVGWTAGTARDHLRVASKLGDLPRIDDALRLGELSYSKVRALVRVATPANEEALLEDARHATATQLETLCRKYATVVRAAKQVDEVEDRERRTVIRRDLDDGMVRIEATLHPEEAAIVWAALDRIARDRAHTPAPALESRPSQDTTLDITSERRTLANAEEQELVTTTVERSGSRKGSRFSRVDALVEIAEGVLRGDAPDRSPIELVVTVAAETLREPHAVADPIASVADGTCVSAETALRLACDCGVVPMVEDGHGHALSVGRKTRSIPTSIKRALLRRDRCCRFPGCSNRLFVEGHHIEHWAHGGETSLGNLVGLCSHHHRFVHEYGYRVEIADGQPRFHDSHGREIVPAPERPRPDDLGWTAIVEANHALAITADTNTCRWDGEVVDHGHLIDGLVRLDGIR